MDHPLVHPFPSGTRWRLPDSTLISPYPQANSPCTVTSSHETRADHSYGYSFVLPYLALDTFSYLLAVAPDVTLYYRLLF